MQSMKQGWDPETVATAFHVLARQIPERGKQIFQ